MHQNHQKSSQRQKRFKKKKKHQAQEIKICVQDSSAIWCVYTGSMIVMSSALARRKYGNGNLKQPTAIMHLRDDENGKGERERIHARARDTIICYKACRAV